MSAWIVRVETSRVYEFDFQSLRDLYPDEYNGWLEAGNDPEDERGFIADCFDQGGPSVYPGYLGDDTDLWVELR